MSAAVIQLDNPKTQQDGCYLEDGKRKADYVLVFERRNIPEPLTTYVRTYLKTLMRMGLQLESFGGMDSNNIFILIHIPPDTIKRCSDLYNIRQEKRVNLPQVVRTPLRGFTAALHQIPVMENDEFTSANRIILINKILESANYGTKPEEYGLSKLMRKKVVHDAFPLHDGLRKTGREDIELSYVDLNDRQLLLETWANFKYWYKEVPLDLVQRYFGCEIAFYFAWLEFFNLMLLPAAVFGVIVFIISTLVVVVTKVRTVVEVCNEHGVFLCPTCELQKNCKYAALSLHCTYAKWNHVFDNYLTLTFAVFMSFWATVFLKYWRRKENRLKLRWNIQFEASKTEMRQAFADGTKRRHLSKFSNLLEPYMPKYVNVLHITCTISAFILLVFVVLVAVFAVVVYKITIPKLLNVENETFFSLATSSMIQVIIIKLFEKPYQKISIWLTDLENPKTEYKYDSSVLHKKYLLSFANNYAILFYIAFVKGHLLSKPHRIVFHTVFEKDTCQPFGCIVALCVQLAFLMVLKNLAGNLLTLTFMRVKKCVKKRFSGRQTTSYTVNDVPLFEKQYKLQRTNRYLLMTDFCEVIIEYGFLTFFAAAFPLAPLIALANNIIELRFQATRLVTKYRRPLPRIVRGIGNWNGILLGVTYLSTATNAFVTAFTSDFVGRKVYNYRFSSSLRGYINYTLSAFATEEYDAYAQISPKPEMCYYRGKRFPPDDRNRYTLTDDHWQEVTWRLIYVFIFEHLIVIFNAILSYSTSDIPTSVHTQLNIDRQLAKEAKKKLFNEETKKSGKKGKENVHVESEQFAPALNRKEFGNAEPMGGFD